ncbi:MAG: iron chelate uptake ABC transporter family permease subunit, partial [bacterium]|nr:iron chelate uptake ABC transporter family permease subunit [bacterium]
MSKSKKILLILILAIVFVIALYLSAYAGNDGLGFGLLKKSFDLGNDTESILLEVLRFPRVVKAVIAGACLALSGMMLQAVSKNPLAEPFITGISAGAGLGIVLSVLLFSGFAYSLFGFVGALIASIFVILFCG